MDTFKNLTVLRILPMKKVRYRDTVRMMIMMKMMTVIKTTKEIRFRGKVKKNKNINKNLKKIWNVLQ